MVQKNRLLNLSIVIGVGVCVVLAGILAWLSFEPKSAISQPLVYNAFFPDEIKNDSFRYYNGNSLYKYDIRSATSTPLLSDKYYLLENISSLYWLENAVVFTISEATDWSTFNSFDIIEGPDSVVWYMSLSDGAVKQLSIDIEASNLGNSVFNTPSGLIVLANDKIDIIDKNGEVSALFNDSSLNAQTVLTIVDYTEKSLLYVSKINDNYALYKYDSTSQKNELIADGLVSNPEIAENFTIYKSGESIVYTDTVETSDETAQNIVRYDMKTKQRSILLSDFIGLVEQSAVTQTNIDTISIYNDVDGSLAKVHAVDDFASQPLHTSCVAEVCYMFQRGGIVRAIAKNENDITFIKPGYHDPLEKVIKSDTLSVTRNILSFSDNEYSVAIADGQLQQRYKELIDLVVEAKQNPAAFTFVITPGRAVEY
jgi:hypothetical protein